MLDTPLITTRLNALLAALVLAGVTGLVAGGAGYALGHRVAKAWMAGQDEIIAVRFPVTPEPDDILPEG